MPRPETGTPSLQRPRPLEVFRGLFMMSSVALYHDCPDRTCLRALPIPAHRYQPEMQPNGANASCRVTLHFYASRPCPVIGSLLNSDVLRAEHPWCKVPGALGTAAQSEA